MPAASWTKSRSQNNTQIDKPKQQQDQADECSEELLPQVQLQVRQQKAQNATTVQFNSFEKFWGKCCASESKERKDYNKNGISKKSWKGE